MPQYVYLVTWTDQGITNVKDTIQRTEAFRKLTESMGGKAGQVVWTLGRCDIVAMIEAPDDETAAALSMKVSGLGNVRVETLRAFSDQDMSTILGKLG